MMPSRKGKQAAEVVPVHPLDDRWVDKGDRPFVPTVDYPIRLRVAPTLLPDADGKLWPRTFGWPLTLDESRRLSPAEALRTAEAERTKPTPKLDAWFLMRCRDAIAEARDLDTRHRLMDDAYKDFLLALAVAYRKGRGATRAQTQAAAEKNAKNRLKAAEKWRDLARAAVARGGDESLKEMATRIQDICAESGSVPFEDRQGSLSDDSDDDTGYYPSIDTIIRFLRPLAKNQPQ